MKCVCCCYFFKRTHVAPSGPVTKKNILGKTSHIWVSHTKEEAPRVSIHVAGPSCVYAHSNVLFNACALRLVLIVNGTLSRLIACLHLFGSFHQSPSYFDTYTLPRFMITMQYMHLSNRTTFPTLTKRNNLKY